jgi:hypothetical protein
MIRTRAIVVLLSSLAATAPLAAQTPWGKVPAFPTQCYMGMDTFTAKNDGPGDIAVAMDAMQSAIGKQEAVNRALDDKLANLDPDTRQSRMMEFMQKNPQQARAFLLSMQQGAASMRGGGEMGALLQRKEEFGKRFDALKQDYDADRAKVLGPLQAQYQHDAKQSSSATEAQVKALVARINTTYDDLCKRWIIGGKFPAFLTEFRTFMNDEYLPAAAKEAELEPVKLEAFGIKATDYRSTEPMSAVKDYMNYASWAFGLRSMKSPMTWP